VEPGLAACFYPQFITRYYDPELGLNTITNPTQADLYRGG